MDGRTDGIAVASTVLAIRALLAMRNASLWRVVKISAPCVYFKDFVAKAKPKTKIKLAVSGCHKLPLIALSV